VKHRATLLGTEEPTPLHKLVASVNFSLGFKGQTTAKNVYF